jgi:hypothetical protein
MKKFSSLLAVLIFAFCFGAVQDFAQKQSKPKQAIILELSVQDKNYETFKMPINLNKIGSTKSSNEGLAKDYGPNYDEKVEGPLGPGYSVKWKADVISKNQTKITLTVKIEDGIDVNRKVRKTFLITRNRQTKLQLKNNVNFVAYYGFETEEQN